MSTNIIKVKSERVLKRILGVKIEDNKTKWKIKN